MAENTQTPPKTGCLALVGGLNLALSFLLELIALVVFTAWGFQIGESWPVKLILGLGAPALMILLWARYMAPRSATRLHDPWHLIFEIVIFGAAVLALLSIGSTGSAVLLGVIVAINIGLTFAFNQRTALKP